MNSSHILLKQIVLSVLILSLTSCLATSQNNLTDDLKQGTTIYIKDSVFTEDINLNEILDFTQTKLGEKRAFVKGNVIFDNCVFKGMDFYENIEGINYVVEFKKNMIFKKCLFQGVVDFSYSVFNNDFSFQNCEFIEPLTMSNTHFKGRNTDFSSSVFHNEVKITNALFDNNLQFLRTTFEENAIFQNTTVKGNANFGGSIFMKFTEFGGTYFFQKLNMNMMTFLGKTNFSNMNVYGMASFNNTKFEDKVIFKRTFFHAYTNIASCEFSKGYELKESNFLIEQKTK